MEDGGFAFRPRCAPFVTNRINEINLPVLVSYLFDLDHEAKTSFAE